MHLLPLLESGLRSLPTLLGAAAIVGAGLGPTPEPAPEPGAAKGPTRVGILIFDGVELLDFAGPAEVFVVAREARLFRVLTVAEEKRPIRTMGELTVTPDHDYGDAPAFDVLVVPGGNMRNVTPKEFLKQVQQHLRLPQQLRLLHQPPPQLHRQPKQHR